MIDFTNVKAVMIGGKAVKKITRGSTVIWKASGTSGAEEIVLLPETEIAAIVISGVTYGIDILVLNQMVTVDDVLKVYVDDVSEEVTLVLENGRIAGYGGNAELMSTGEGIYANAFSVRVTGDFGSTMNVKITKKVSA